MKHSCVLMYHGLSEAAVPSSDIGTSDPAYTITPSQFERQIDFLQEQGYKVQSLERYFEAAEPHRGRVIMTFDDGNLSDYSVALPMLQRCGYTATFYITTDWIGRPGFLSKSDIRCLHDEGMEIGSHGHTHMYFDDMTTESLTEELTTSVNILSEIVGNTIGTLGAPGGRLHPHLGTVARKVGIRTIATSRTALLHAGTNPFAVPRVPVGHAITLDEFRKITGGDVIYYRRQKIRKAVLNGAKRLFGNKRYESLRAKLMSCF